MSFQKEGKLDMQASISKYGGQYFCGSDKLFWSKLYYTHAQIPYVYIHMVHMGLQTQLGTNAKISNNGFLGVIKGFNLAMH